MSCDDQDWTTTPHQVFRYNLLQNIFRELKTASCVTNVAIVSSQVPVTDCRKQRMTKQQWNLTTVWTKWCIFVSFYTRKITIFFTNTKPENKTPFILRTLPIKGFLEAWVSVFKDIFHSGSGFVYLKSGVDVKSSGFDAVRPLPDLYCPPPQAAALWRQNLTTVNMAHTHCSHVG